MGKNLELFRIWPLDLLSVFLVLSMYISGSYTKIVIRPEGGYMRFKLKIRHHLESVEKKKLISLYLMTVFDE